MKNIIICIGVFLIGLFSILSIVFYQKDNISVEQLHAATRLVCYQALADAVEDVSVSSDYNTLNIGTDEALKETILESFELYMEGLDANSESNINEDTFYVNASQGIIYVEASVTYNNLTKSRTITDKQIVIYDRTSSETLSSYESVELTALEAQDLGYDWTISSGYITITSYTGDATQLSIPSTIGGNEVVYIGSKAFENSNLVSVVMPYGIKGIGEYAFYNNLSLLNIELSGSITSINNHAFDGCSSLASIVLPSNLTAIGSDVFTNCTGLSSIYVSSQTIYDLLINKNNTIEDLIYIY